MDRSTKLRFSTAYRPQTDGQTERMNQSLEHYLRCFTDNNPYTWPTLLPSAHFALNRQINATTNQFPFDMLYGWIHDFHIPESVFQQTRSRGAAHLTGRERVPAVDDRHEKLQKLRQSCVEHWKHAMEYTKKYFDSKYKLMEFKVQQWVVLSTKNLKLKGSSKLAPKYVGPFMVVERIGKLAYRLALPEKYSRLHNVFHVSLLEPWKQRDSDNLLDETQSFPEHEDQDEEWEVEDIRDKDVFEDEVWYLVKWKGWPSDYNQ